MNKAFSLIELLIILALLGIALGLGLPSIQSYVTHSQLNQTAEEVAALVKRVAAQALTTSESHHLNVPFSNTLSWGADGGSDQSLKLSHGAISDCKLSTGAPCGAKLDFSGRGLPAAQYNLTVQHKGRSQKIVVLLTGKVVIPR